MCTSHYWKGHIVKDEIAIAEGKKAYDKRIDSKEKDWSRQKQGLVRHAKPPKTHASLKLWFLAAQEAQGLALHNLAWSLTISQWALNGRHRPHRQS